MKRSGKSSASLDVFCDASQSCFGGVDVPGSINGNARELKALKDGSTSVYLQTLVAGGDWIVFPLADALFAPYVQLVSVTATTVTPVVQAADREILLLVRNYLD